MNMRSASTVPAASLFGWPLRRSGFTRGMAIGSVLFWAACSEDSQELDERVTQLQKELDRTQVELQSTKQALNTSKEELNRLKASSGNINVPATKPAANNLSALPSREAFEASYTTTAKTLKEQIQAQLKDFTLDTCILHNIEMPSSEYPVTSKVSLSLHASGGTAFRIDFPVKADSGGRWVFPGVSEIVRRIEETTKSTAAVKPSLRDSSRAASAQQRPASGSMGMPTDGTVVIQWPDSGGSTAPRNQMNAAPVVDAPAKGLGNSAQSPVQTPKSIPADRDVLIKF